MSKTVSFDYSKAGKFLGADELQNFKTITLNARDTLLSKTGAGNDFLGWIDLPVCYDKEEFERIKATAKKIKEDSDVLLVVGIGGSYLGARAATVPTSNAKMTPVIPFIPLKCTAQNAIVAPNKNCPSPPRL